VLLISDIDKKKLNEVTKETKLVRLL